jgi:hypothetical protein
VLLTALSREFVPVLAQIDLSTGEAHTLHLKPEALFSSGLSRQLDLSASTNYALPGKSARRGFQEAGDGS